MQQKFFTVKNLKLILEKVDENLPVGVVGHFGEFIPANSDSFCIRKAHLVPSNKTWRSMNSEETDIFSIPVIDLGSDPD